MPDSSWVIIALTSGGVVVCSVREELSVSQYKVPQNVEAEDKIIGPLTFKQFIYALVGIFWGLMSFALLRNFIPIMIVVGVPPTLLFLLLAFFTRDGQNFEQLLIALVSFTVNSRRRIWIKEDLIEALHIEPTKVVAEQTQRNPAEIRSQLEKIASMVDSRGWENPAEVAGDNTLIRPDAAAHTAASASPAGTPTALASEPAASEDILDMQHSPLALNLSNLINSAAEDVRAEAIEQMKAKAAHRSSSTVTAPSSSGILELATESDDLTVSQLAASANRMVPGQIVEVRDNGNATK